MVMEKKGDRRFAKPPAAKNRTTVKAVLTE
jgi:hypothetical protein